MGDYRATIVIPGAACCSAVSVVTDKVWLLREAPRLPMTYCTRMDECACRYQKVPDRRQALVDRRKVAEAAAKAAGTWQPSDRRRSPGRRATDLVAA